MAPSKKRSVIDAKPVARRRVGPRACPCLTRPHSDGICELNVWQGTTIEMPDGDNARAKLLHRHMRVLKYKDLTLESFSGYMYLMVMLRWLPLLALFGAIYIAVVGVFALLFALCNADLTVPDAKPRDYFNLSVQTMATIGYGVLFPKDSCSNWVAVIESFVSMIVISLMTGIAFVKFARPRSQIICSDVFTVSQREGGPDAGLEMRFRVVNGTRRDLIMRGEILEVSFKLVFMRIEETKSGEKKLCYYDLHLKTTSYITLRLEAEIIHEIEEDSPLFGMTQDDFAKADFLIILMMSGVDETLHDTVHKQFEFTYESMRWGTKFVPILTWDRLANHIELDFQHISAVVSASIKQTTQNGDLQIVVDENPANNTTLSTETEGNMDMAEELENVADSNHEEDKKLLRHTQLLLSLPNGGTDTGIDYSDLESMISYREDAPIASDSPGISPEDADATGNHTNSASNEDDESKSVVSTRTNSGSENEERHEATPMHHIRFDRRIRTTSFRVPRISRRHRGHINPLEPVGSTRRHNHESHHDVHDEPMSLMRRRVRFKNHPLSRFSKGLYYRALETSWLRLFVYLAFIYFSAIAVMALLMHLSARHAVVNTAGVEVDNHYERIFFFCAQTISTIGYGSLAPKPQSDLMNFYVCILSIAGMVVSTLVTGLAWAKFSIPKASTIAFSDYLLLTAFHSHRAIVFRAANRRTYGAIIECSFRVSVVILNQRLGHKETHELKLVRNVWPVVQLATTVTHIIDEDSPLFDVPTDELLSGRHFFVVLFSGLDPVVGENMFSRKTYHSCDILVGHHFVDNIKLTSEGVHVDLEAINGTTLTPEIDLRESRLYPASETSPPLESSHETEPTCDTFFVEPYEAQRRRRREADEEESISVTPRAAQYALM